MSDTNWVSDLLDFDEGDIIGKTEFKFKTFKFTASSL